MGVAPISTKTIDTKSITYIAAFLYSMKYNNTAIKDKMARKFKG